MDTRLNVLKDIICSDLKPAFGVTEPGAIAYAAAKARETIGGEVQSIELALNSGIFKNSFTCGIPNTDHRGCAHAAALGAIGGDASLGLEALKSVDKKDDALASRLVDSGKVKVDLDRVSSTIYIQVRVHTANGVGEVVIEGTHTNITKIVRNDDVLFFEDFREEMSHGECAKIRAFTLNDFYTFARDVDIDELGFLDEAFQMNHTLFEEGQRQNMIPIISVIIEKNGGKIYGGGAQNAAKIVACGAIEARVNGTPKPAMSVAGSGSHGILTVMPVFAAGKELEKPMELIKRAAALACLVTIYIKEYSGRLSALCGCTMAGGTGTAIGLVFLNGGTVEQMTAALNNMASSITGMICHGGNPGCVLKAVTGIDMAFLACELALANCSVECCHGILSSSPENTMQNIGVISSPGMSETEGYIVDIMAKNK